MEEKQIDLRMKLSQELLADTFNGEIKGSEFSLLNLLGLQIVQSESGCLIFNFTVPSRLSDGDGNWEVGAMATMIDELGIVTAFILKGITVVTLDLNVSYLSTAKVQEEVEIEAKILGLKGKLSLVGLEVRRKGDAKLIAVAKQWVASASNAYFQRSNL